MYLSSRRIEVCNTPGQSSRRVWSRYLAAMALLAAWVTHSQVAAAQAFSVVPRTLAWSGADAPAYTSDWSNGSIVMPFVSSSSHSGEAQRINEALYVQIVGIPAPTGTGKSFTLPATSDIPNSGYRLDSITSLGFTVGRNDAHILSITIERDGCGAYCEDWTESFHFNATTGAAFTADDVISPEARTTIVRMMKQERTRQYTALLKELRAQRRTQAMTGTPDKAKDADADLDERIGFNEQCLAGLTEARSDTSSDSSDTFRYLKLAIPDAKSVTFVAERCSNHAMRALDDVGDVTLRISDDKLRGFLTAYGRTLFFGDDEPQQPSSPRGQVLHGRIGSASITMRVAADSDASSGTAIYFYEKYRLPITLSSARNGNTLRLTNGKEGRDLETFELVAQGNGYTGVWHKDARELPVVIGF
ncbi:hypothetical protein [Dyella terrae]|uniref:hypothetical protein n=1 Tax=Dyella terrae TaxID=522259 RepID=UPI001EFCEF49|nr:hypothetical protein [Dyella terrae]ULU26461.1 hypothetical protein DYST_03407 [Dyella terrae]